MSKVLDIIMAGVIAGLVTYSTSKLGIGGTVIGAVIGAMLFQLMSYFFRDPLENIKTQRLEREIFYTFPLVVIVIIEMIFLLSTIYQTPEEIFYSLESATGWNLFRTIGLGLLVMGIYPLLQPQNIKKEYGYIILAVGIVKLVSGFADTSPALKDLYILLFYQINEIISILVIIALSYVIFSIARESLTIIYEKDDNNIK